jgi:hypothetical protein
VSKVVYDGMVMPLTNLCFGSGWYDAEHGDDVAGWRWMDGDGRLLMLPGLIFPRHALDVEVAITGCYWLTEPSIASGCVETTAVA